jgi:hypothetical protein
VNTSPDPAAPSAPAAVPKKGFYQGPWPFVVATGGEFVGLFFWLAYFDAGQYVLGTIVLWAGFLTERYVVLNWTAAFRGLLAAEYPDAPHYDSFQAMSPVQKLAKLLIITVTEISIWVTAVLVFDHVNWVAAFAVLILGEQLQHSWELGLIASRPITDYIPTWKALTITLLETVGGIIWIALVRHQQPQLGGLFILIGLSIEHVVQSKKIQVDLGAQVEQQAKAAAGTSEAVPVPAAAGTAGAVGASA